MHTYNNIYMFTPSHRHLDADTHACLLAYLVTFVHTH